MGLFGFLIATWLDLNGCIWTSVNGPFDQRFHILKGRGVRGAASHCLHINMGCTWAHLFVTCHSLLLNILHLKITCRHMHEH